MTVTFRRADEQVRKCCFAYKNISDMSVSKISTSLTQ